MKGWENYGALTTEGKAGARLVERLHQMTPSNDAMVSLAKLGLWFLPLVTEALGSCN